MQNNLHSQKNLIKINYEDLKKALTRDGQNGAQQQLSLHQQLQGRKNKNQIQIA